MSNNADEGVPKAEPVQNVPSADEGVIFNQNFIKDRKGHLIQFAAGDSNNLYAKIAFKSKVFREDDKKGKGKTYHICDENNEMWSFSLDEENATKMEEQLQMANITPVDTKDLPKNTPTQRRVLLIMYPGGVVFRHPCLRF